MDHLIQKCPSRPQCHLLDGAKYILSWWAWAPDYTGDVECIHRTIGEFNIELSGEEMNGEGRQTLLVIKSRQKRRNGRRDCYTLPKINFQPF